MFIDANLTEANSEVKAEYCVVGSGMAGASIAKQLSAAGRAVLLVEAGNLTPARGNGGQSVTSEHVGRSFNVPPTRCIELGGTSNQWHGICAPLDEIDFAERSWIPDSGWPITLDELRPYYDAAASVHEIPGGRFFQETALGPPFSDRLRDIQLNDSVVRRKVVYYRKPPMRWKEYLVRLAESGSLRCLLNATALELVPSETGAAVEYLIVGASDHTLTVRAKTFVVCCGALETPRLLLNSRTASSRGIGNEHDLVGRNLLDHPAGHFCKLRFRRRTSAPLFAASAFSEKVSMTLAVTNTAEYQESHQLANHYLWIRPSVTPNRIDDELLLSFLAVRGARDLSWRQIRAILTNRDLQYRILVHRFGLHPSYRYGDLYFTTEQLPNLNSRVRLSTRQKDRHGYPISSIDWQLSEDDMHGFHRYAKLLFESGLHSDQYELARVDDPEIWDRGLASTAHHLGTAKMARDPRRGVVDRNLRVFGVSNLFVCDGSVFPTAGAANPSLTITALALRLSEHLLESQPSDTYTSV
jgi:choline dehydrogenase-like flavoprotein